METPNDGQPVPSPGNAIPEARSAGLTTTRELALIIALLGVGLGFIFSYVGAFHKPTPHGASIAVVAPAQASALAVRQIDAIPGHPLSARAVPSVAAARSQLQSNTVAAALVLNPAGTQDRLLTASAGGAALTEAVQDVVSQAEAAQHRTVAITDVVPLQSGDYRGLTSFYAVVGWLVSGYLLASLLGIAAGARVSTMRSILRRFMILTPYAVAAGVGGTLILDNLLGAQTGQFAAQAGVGTLLVFAAGSVTIALQEMVGIVGIGLAILLFVVLGNPSAGGAYQNALLPGFWRAIGNAIPNGAGVDALRRIVYFHGDGITTNLVVIGLYCLVPILAAISVTAWRTRRQAEAVGYAAVPAVAGA